MCVYIYIYVYATCAAKDCHDGARSCGFVPLRCQMLGFEFGRFWKPMPVASWRPMSALIAHLRIRFLVCVGPGRLEVVIGGSWTVFQQHFLLSNWACKDNLGLFLLVGSLQFLVAPYSFAISILTLARFLLAGPGKWGAMQSSSSLKIDEVAR